MAQLERSLRRLGLAPGAVDGSFDAATGDAVARLYRRHGFQPVVATEQTLAGARPAEAGLVAGGFARPGVQLPSDEVVFVGSGPLRVTELPAAVGSKPEGALATVTGLRRGHRRPAAGRAGRPGAHRREGPGRRTHARHRRRRGRVTSVAGRPGTDGADGFHVSFRVAVKDPPAALVGASVRLTIPIRSTRTAQLTVPVTAVSLGPDGGSRVEKVGGRRERFVAVRTGLSADGFVSITAKPGALAAGDRVVVGFQPRPRAEADVPPLVRLEKVSRSFGADVPVRALREVDFEVAPGERVSVVGASGSGKTTLLNIIGCLDQQTSGSYWMDGVDVSTLTDRGRAGLRSREIGFVFQSFHLLSYRTVLENVMLAEVYGGGRERSGRAERARAALESVGIEDRAEALPTRLSGGQRQRVAIARAIVGRPRILLCDEPTGNLDSTTTASILELLGSLYDEGLTIIVITHDAGVAAWAERNVRIADGQIQDAS